MQALDQPLRDGVDIETVKTVKSVGEQYKYGFVTDIEMDFAPKGISEDRAAKDNTKKTLPDTTLLQRQRPILLLKAKGPR